MPSTKDRRSSAPTAAVVADRWPLMRVGLARAATLGGMRVAGEGRDLASAMALARQSGAGMLVVGDGETVTRPELKRAAETAKVFVLVRCATRDDLSGILNAGVSGVSLRSATLEELSGLLRRAAVGERAVSAALLPTLVGRDAGEASTPRPVDAGALALTAKEREVLSALAIGASNQEIASKLYVTPATIKTHLAHIYAKLGVGGRHEALSRAVALGIVH